MEVLWGSGKSIIHGQCYQLSVFLSNSDISIIGGKTINTLYSYHVR